MVEKVLASRRHGLIVAGFVLASSLVRLYLAHTYYGFQTGDDLEIAEEAFRRAFGLVHTPWNIRSLLIPDAIVAPFVAAAHACGVRDALSLATVARYPFVILAGANVALVYLLGRRWYDERAAVVAAALYSAHWIPLVYGSSLYPRVVATTCILAAALLLSRPTTAGRAVAAGVLAALAVTARYSEAVFCASLLVAGGKWSRRSGFAFVAAFIGGVVLFVGAYDRLTWGGWFKSALAFADLVFVRRDASSLVVSQPPWWYVGNLLHWFALTLLPLFAVAVRRGERRRAIAYVAVPLLAFSAVFHKELRYLQVVIPFVLLISARGFVLWFEQPNRRRVAAALLLLALPLGAARIGVAAKRSTNAVTAAIWMRQRQFAAVALSQPWAYGGRLFLGNATVIRDVDIPVDRERVSLESPSVEAVGVFSSEADDALREICTRAGLAQITIFGGRGGREVTVFHRREPLIAP